MLVGCRIGSRGALHLLKIEGVQDFLDPFLELRLGPDRHDLVLIHEHIEERLIDHDSEAAQAILKKKAPVTPEAVCEPVHPVQVETVAWASERKNLYSTAFALGST